MIDDASPSPPPPGAPSLPCRTALMRAVPLPVLEIGLVLAWSSGFVGARFAVDHAPVFLVTFWRFAVVTLLLLPWVAGQILCTPPAVLLRQSGIGLLAVVCYLAGVTKGIELGVPAGLAALAADLLPVGTALLAAVVLGQPQGPRVWLGLFVGAAGVALVAWETLAWGRAPPWAYVLPVLGMLALAVATLWQKGGRSPASMGLLPQLWLQCAVAAVAFAGLSAWEGRVLPVASAGFALSVAWTAGLSTLGGYGLYWLCLRRTSPTRVASVLYLSPSVTLVWSWAMFGERLSWLMMLGTAVCAAGVWQVARQERQ